MANIPGGSDEVKSCAPPDAPGSGRVVPGRTISRAARRRKRTPRSLSSSLAEAEDELRVVGHLVRRPRRIEDELELDVLHPGHFARHALHVTRDQRACRTAHRREAVDDLHLRTFDLDLVDEPEIDDVHTELRIFDLAERFEQIVLTGHDASLPVAPFHPSRARRANWPP